MSSAGFDGFYSSTSLKECEEDFSFEIDQILAGGDLGGGSEFEEEIPCKNLYKDTHFPKAVVESIERFKEVSFDQLTKNLEISVVKAGHKKNGQDKQYVLLRKSEAGASSDFYIGFSPKGKQRAVLLKSSDAQGSQRDQEMMAINQKRFKEYLDSSPKEEGIQHISRILYVDPNVKITELCGIDLKKFMEENRDLSEEDLINIIEQILKGLFFIHKKGFVHKDLNIKNIVVNRDGEGALIVKIIDWDLVGGAVEEDHQLQGSIFYLPVNITNRFLGIFEKEESSEPEPSINLASHRYPKEWTTSAQDIWALMYLIGQVGIQLNQHISEGFLERFKEYKEIVEDSIRNKKDVIDSYQKKREYLANKLNLFSGLQPKTFVDHLLYKMAEVDCQARPSAEDLLSFIREDLNPNLYCS